MTTETAETACTKCGGALLYVDCDPYPGLLLIRRVCVAGHSWIERHAVPVPERPRQRQCEVCGGELRPCAAPETRRCARCQGLARCGRRTGAQRRRKAAVAS
ncbi:MAG TPA: hypothetical protein VNJ53_13940 [Gaiellaceae bacterium]|nr:hypothetical protein [Gaiellaceae bacterium]